METLNIAKLIGTPNAILQKFGLQVHKAVVDMLSVPNQTVTLDFNCINNATTGFFHASVGNLYRELGTDYNKRVYVIGLENPVWRGKYEESIEFAANPKQANQIDSAISDLFA